MAALFETAPGSFSFLPESKDIPLRVYVDGAPFDEASLSAILSGVRIGLADNVGTTHSLLDTVYLYVFGRKISSLVLSGVSFLTNGCGSGGDGLSSILDYYERYRAGARSEPVRIQVGTGRSGLFEGFLPSIVVDASQPEAMLGGFSLAFQVLPASRS
jgi:hypothetical protein